MDIDFTPRGVAKFVVNGAVKFKAAKITEHAITDYTRFEEDDFVVEITSGLVGGYIGHKLKPVTDWAVDKTADFVVTTRAKFTKKDKPDTE
jgi:hypothetical protein